MKKIHHDIKHEGNLDGERVKMTFDENSVPFLMSVLTDMYSDPELAAIREYSTNAYDSHVAAGITDPIEVELPSSLLPQFVVRDHGVGMSVYDITEHFSKYGWSSKRDNDDEVGMLGLGCKSGLTYTSQFSIEAIKDGVKCLALVTRDTDGAGAVQVIEVEETDQPNGVEVTIPVRNVNSFLDKAHSFYSYWPKGSVLVDGEEPDGVDGLWLDPDICVRKSVGYNKSDIVVMGNVPYQIHGEDRFSMSYYHQTVVWVPIGSVDIVPSRETLHMTKLTREALDTARQYIRDTFARSVQRDIDAATTKAEAYKVMSLYKETEMRGKVWHYKGELIPPAIYYPILNWSGYQGSMSGRGMVPGEKTPIRIYGRHIRFLTADDKRRIIDWWNIKDSGWNNTQRCPGVEISEEKNDWMDNWYSWEEVTAAVPKQKVTRAKKPKGYEILAGNSKRFTDQAPTGEVCYLSLRRYTMSHWSIKAGILNKLGVTCIVIPTGQIDKLKAQYPGIKEIDDYIKDIVTLFLTSMTEDDWDDETRRQHRPSWARNLSGVANMFHDQDMKDLLVVKNPVQQEWLHLLNQVQNIPFGGKNYRKIEKLVSTLDNRYPLLSECGWVNNHQAIVDYANSLWITRQMRV